MSPLETALVFLVVIWTLIFLILAAALVLLTIQVKKALDKVNHILEKGEAVANDFQGTARMATAGVAGALSKVGTKKMKNMARNVLKSK